MDKTENVPGGETEGLMTDGAGHKGFGNDDAGQDFFAPAARDTPAPEARILEFGLGQDDLVIEYDASQGAPAPLIRVETQDNGDQQVMADGLLVATLVQPLVPITAEDVLVVGLMAS